MAGSFYRGDGGSSVARLLDNAEKAIEAREHASPDDLLAASEAGAELPSVPTVEEFLDLEGKLLGTIASTYSSMHLAQGRR